MSTQNKEVAAGAVDTSPSVAAGPIMSRRGFFAGATALALTSHLPLEAEARESNPSKAELIERLVNPNKWKIAVPKGSKEDTAYNDAAIEKWRLRYLGLDPVYHRKGPGGITHFRDELIAGWKRLNEGDDLKTVHEACQKYGVPFDVVFLALGESHWNKSAASPAKASGPWQFIPATARHYWLIDSSGDYRSDVARSTEAAIRMLRETYDMTKGWDRRYKLDTSKISESDRWAYVFWYYNRGGRVRFDYHRFRGQAEPYSRELSKNSTRTGRYENSQYVVKLLGIRAAIAHMHAQDWFDHPSKRVNLAKTAPTPPGKKKSVGGTANTAPTPTEKKKSPGDLAYERYGADKTTLGWKQQLERLGDIADLYEREAAAAGKTPERDDDAWADGALEAISAEMSAIRQAHAAELKTNLAQNGISTEVAIGDKGEPSISVKIERKNAKGKVEKIEEIDAAPVDYAILPGDRIDDIAKRLSGDVNRWRLAKRIIADLNPDIANIDLIRVGQTIQVPGEYITVPNMSLKKLVAKYYPGVPEGDAIQYLKYLNGLNHNRGDVINVGDVILVPAIR